MADEGLDVEDASERCGLVRLLHHVDGLANERLRSIGVGLGDLDASRMR
ncbi:MAG: hypothetical protein R2710_00310 [Acidimicrobiales bacterium]